MDDTDLETIRKHINSFREQSVPVLQHYLRFDKVREVSCEASIDEVYEQTQMFFKRLWTLHNDEIRMMVKTMETERAQERMKPTQR